MYKKRLHFFFLAIVFAFPVLTFGEDSSSPFDGAYFGIDSAFVSSRSEGQVGPLNAATSVPVPAGMLSGRIPAPELEALITGLQMQGLVPPAVDPANPAPNLILPLPVSASFGPFPFAGTDNLPGGSLFAGYGKTFGKFFVAGEFVGSYGSYDNTNAFGSPNFTSDIDITQGHFGIISRLGFLISRNLLAYSTLGWGRSWIEAEGTVHTISFSGQIPNPTDPTGQTLIPVSANEPLNQSIKSDLVYDGIQFGIGLEYALADLVERLDNFSVRLGYSRIEYRRENFSYNVGGNGPLMLTVNAPLDPTPGAAPVPLDVTVEDNSIPAQVNPGVHVVSLGVSYRIGSF